MQQLSKSKPERSSHGAGMPPSLTAADPSESAWLCEVPSNGVSHRHRCHTLRPAGCCWRRRSGRPQSPRCNCRECKPTYKKQSVRSAETSPNSQRSRIGPAHQTYAISLLSNPDALSGTSYLASGVLEGECHTLGAVAIGVAGHSAGRLGSAALSGSDDASRGCADESSDGKDGFGKHG